MKHATKQQQAAAEPFLAHVFGAGSGQTGTAITNALESIHGVAAFTTQSDAVPGQTPGLLGIDEYGSPVDAAGEQLPLQDCSVGRNCFYNPELAHQLLLAMLKQTKAGGLFVVVVTRDMIGNVAATLQEALRMECLESPEASFLKLDPDSNDEPLFMFVARRGAPGTDAMKSGDDFIEQTLFGDPEVPRAAHLEYPLEGPEDQDAKVFKVLEAARQGHSALTEKWRLQSSLGKKRNRFSGPGAALQSVAAGNFLMSLFPGDYGVEDALETASRLKVPLTTVLLAQNANLAADPISGALAAVKGQLDAAAAVVGKSAGSAAAEAVDSSAAVRLTALSKEHPNLVDYLGSGRDLDTAFANAVGGGLYALQKAGEGVKGVGLSRVNIHNRATEQFGPRGGQYFAVARFPESFCGSSSPDYTAKHTFALESIESYFLICLGGPTSGQVMFGSPATIGHWDASSGGESLGF